MAILGGCSGCLQIRPKNGVIIVQKRTKGKGSILIRKPGGLIAPGKPTGSFKQGCGCN